MTQAMLLLFWNSLFYYGSVGTSMYTSLRRGLASLAEI